MDLDTFVHAVIAYAHFTGASCTSWFRTREHNAAVGGVQFSAHQFALAVDTVYHEVPPLAQRQAVAGRLGLRLVVEGDHDHLQPLDWSAG